MILQLSQSTSLLADHMWRIKLLTFTVLLVTAMTSSIPAQAAPLAPTTNREYLLQVIAQLTAEVARLQRLLAERHGGSSSSKPYEAFLFTRPVEAQYFVQNGKLVPGPRTTPRAVDEQLFDLMVETLGVAAVSTYVKEWRVFHADPTELSAYVEQIAGTDTYVVNINRADFSVDAERNRDAFRELFVHEYAHMLLLHEAAFVDSYEQTFWTAVDRRFVAKGPGEGERERYFASNQHRFVSSYATASVDEDMAETFLFAVLKPDTVREGVIQEKYSFLSSLPRVGAEIKRLRMQLN